jgi:Predicted membrane protein (DUF2127)
MQRPTGVTILAVLAFVGAGLLVLFALAALMGGALLSNMSGYPRFGMVAGAMVAVFLIGFAALEAGIGIGLWKLQNWARVLTIVLTGLGLLASVARLVSPFAYLHFFFFAFLVRRLIVTAIQIWILVYLFKPHVKQAFGATGF